MPVGTVKSRIARGLAQLREILLSPDSAESVGGKTAGQNISPRPADRAANDYDDWDLSSTRVMELFSAA